MSARSGSESATEIGGWFEDKFFKALKELLASKAPVKPVRLYDSKAAQAFLPAQPGDFILAMAGEGVLAELKASHQKQSLAIEYKKSIRPSQIGGARLWIRTGCPSIFVFCGVDSGVLELWDGSAIVEAWMGVKRKLPLSGRRAVYRWKTEQDLVEQIKVMILNLITELQNEAGYLHRPPSGRKANREHDSRLTRAVAREGAGAGKQSPDTAEAKD